VEAPAAADLQPHPSGAVRHFRMTGRPGAVRHFRVTGRRVQWRSSGPGTLSHPLPIESGPMTGNLHQCGGVLRRDPRDEYPDVLQHLAATPGGEFSVQLVALVGQPVPVRALLK